MQNVYLLQGINLIRVGKREPVVYGNTSWSDARLQLQRWLELHWPGVSLVDCTTTSEQEAVEFLHRMADDPQAVGGLINPGAWTHTSLALRDAAAGVGSPLVEVHLSHTYARESYRKSSLVASECVGTVSGFGWLGYTLGFQALLAQQPA